jgi:GH43 family beta-xylosidase
MKLIDFKENQYPSQADPFILKAQDGSFYIYVSGYDGVHAFRSAVIDGEYEDIGIVYSVAGCKEYWAPSVTFIGGKYYMYVSFMKENEDDVHLQTMHVAVSSNPEGPFGDTKRLIEPFSIDTDVVKNEAGSFIF